MNRVTEAQKPDNKPALPKASRKRGWQYLVDILIIVAMGTLLYYGYSAWRFTSSHTDVARYECYAEAFWRGLPALHVFPPSQCSFIKTDTPRPLVQSLQGPGWLVHFISTVEAQQSPTKPLHVLPLEYPLLSIIPFSLGLAAHAQWYRVTFAVWMALLAASIYSILLRSSSRGAAIAFAFYLVVGSWATAEGRFDLMPAGLTLMALVCAQRARWKWAFAMLALATMFKVYPLVLIGPFLIAQHRQLGGRMWYARCRWDALAVFVAVCVVVTGLSLLLSIEGTLVPLSYFETRPFQVESFSASLLWLASFLGQPVHYVNSYGSVNVLSQLSPLVERMDTVCMGVGVLSTFWLQWRGKLELFTASLVTLLMVIVTAKVFSPQYLIWVTPLVAYIGKSNWRWLVSWGGIGFLTTLIYPYLYKIPAQVVAVPLLPAFQPVLLARNMLVLAVILMLLYQATRSTGYAHGPKAGSTGGSA